MLLILVSLISVCVLLTIDLHCFPTFDHFLYLPLNLLPSLPSSPTHVHCQTDTHMQYIHLMSTLKHSSISCQTHTHLRVCAFSFSLSSSRTADADTASRLMRHTVTNTQSGGEEKKRARNQSQRGRGKREWGRIAWACCKR